MSEEELYDPDLETIMLTYKILGQRVRYLTSGYWKNKKGSTWYNLDYCNTQ